jgi:serine/threonine protein kinase
LGENRKEAMESKQYAFPLRYQKDRCVGNGFTGQVWIAKDLKNNGDLVAIKTLSRQLYEKHTMKFPPFEVSLIALLSHENIVRLLEVIHESECIFLVQEYLCGGDLFSCMQETGVFSEFLARCCFGDIVAGLAYIHGKGIVHRDLKPENCVLDLNGTVKIIDFGFATRFFEGQLLTDYCGSPDYAAPEVLREMPYEGPPSDVWSAGVVLYDMVMGDIPFHEDDLIAFTIPATLESSVSSELSLLLRGILMEIPHKRMTTSQIFSSAWMNLPVCFRSDSEVELVLMGESTTFSSPHLILSPNSPLFRGVLLQRANILNSDLKFLSHGEDMSIKSNSGMTSFDVAQLEEPNSCLHHESWPACQSPF